MHPTLIHHLSSAVAAGDAGVLADAPGTASYFGWVILSGLLGLRAVIRVLRRPADRWAHRNWSKLAWIVAILYIAPAVGGYPIPLGAIAALWRTRRPTSSPSFGRLPRVEGSTDWPLPWHSK